MKKLMKKLILAASVVLLAALAVWGAVGGMSVNWNGSDLDGPAGALLGLLFAGGGVLLAILALTGVALLVGVIFAGLGLLMVTLVSLLALLAAALVSPLLLALLIPFGILWLLVARLRKSQVQPV